jgi:hypothetical protein
LDIPHHIPLGVLGFVLSVLYMPNLAGDGGRDFDFLGFVVFSLSLAIFSFCLEVAPDSRLPFTLGLLSAGLLMMALYWGKLYARKGALFAASLFKKPGYIASVGCNLCSRIGSGAIPFILPLFLQLSMGLSPLRAGFFMIPQALGSLVGKCVVPFLLFRVGFRRFLLLNTLVLGLLVASFSLIRVDSNGVLLSCLFFVFGAINSMQFTGLNSLILINLTPCEAGSGNTLLSVIIQISNNSGVTLGAALLGVYAFAFQGGAFSASAPGAGIFQAAFFTVGVVILSASLLVKRLGRHYGEQA